MKRHLIGLFILSVAFLMSCQKDDYIATDAPGKYEKGIFIVNEGAFFGGNGSITFYDDDVDSTAANIFSSTNGRPLGDVAQSISFHNGYGYIVVNNSNKIEVVDANTFEEVATITGLSFPRYFLPINDNKAYVSQWGSDGLSGSVKIINLNTNTVTDSILTNGFGPDKMAMIDNKVFVGHIGGYGTDNNFAVINTDANAVVDNIISEFNPNDFVEDKNGLVWVLTLGAYDWTNMVDNPGKITAYAPNSLSFIRELELPSSVYSTDFKINSAGDRVYFILGYGVVAMDLQTSPLPLTLITLDSGSNFYGLGYDTTTDRIYAGIAPDFSSNGTVNVYNESGDLLETINAGIGPGDITVKK